MAAVSATIDGVAVTIVSVERNGGSIFVTYFPASGDLTVKQISVTQLSGGALDPNGTVIATGASLA